MKLWVDDVRPAPEGYVWCKNFYEAKSKIYCLNQFWTYYSGLPLDKIELIDIGYNGCDYANDGGNYIMLLNWLEETDRNYPIRIHSMNPVGVENMRRIIERNGWTEVR